jgi:hypothetical protein
LSVRLKLTLSYAGFVLLAGAVLLAAGYFSLSRGVHPGVIFIVQSHADLLRYFAPIAAIVMAFLLVFGLLGGWLLAGRMLAPLASPHGRHPRRPRTDRSPTESSWRDVRTSSANSPTASTPCSRASKHTSPNSSDSQPTPPTNCAPH